MTIKEIKKEFGMVQHGCPGSWCEVYCPCPECKKEMALLVEIDNQQEGGVLTEDDEVIECEHCGCKFKAAYFIEPTIIFEKI